MASRREPAAGLPVMPVQAPAKGERWWPVALVIARAINILA
jgi:hypothetical protein